jgi:hypothetical protein
MPRLLLTCFQEMDWRLWPWRYGVEGRHLLNRLAAFYVLPYFDVGVKLVADGHGGIAEACGAVHYIRPDGSTLQDRKVYNADQLKAAGLAVLKAAELGLTFSPPMDLKKITES